MSTLRFIYGYKLLNNIIKKFFSILNCQNCVEIKLYFKFLFPNQFQNAKLDLFFVPEEGPVWEALKIKVQTLKLAHLKNTVKFNASNKQPSFVKR